MADQVSRQQAIDIATARAVADPHGMFATPHLVSVASQAGSGHWVVRFLSARPSRCVLGGNSMRVVVDKDNGNVVSVDSGGGT